MAAGHVGILGKKAATGSYDPLSLPGLQVWLDAADGSKFTYGAGSQVATWTDKSANGFVFSRTASAAIQRNTTRNGLDTVDVSAAGKLACTPGTPICTAAFTMFCVFIKKGANQTFESIPFTMSSGNAGRPLDGHGSNRYVQAITVTTAATDIKTQTSIGQLTMQFNDATDDWLERKNGAAVVTTTTATAINTTSQVLTVASRGDSATQLLGEVCEVLVSDQFLTGTDRTDCESYLRSRWGTP